MEKSDSVKELQVNYSPMSIGMMRLLNHFTASLNSMKTLGVLVYVRACVCVCVHALLCVVSAMCIGMCICIMYNVYVLTFPMYIHQGSLIKTWMN